MSVAPHAGIIDFGTFTSPTASQNGIQGEVPAPLSSEIGYALTTEGWAPFIPPGSLGSMAYQNANSVAITGGSIDGTTIGATTASTGSFTTLTGGAGSANYGQLTGGATTKAIEWKSLGSDTNVAFAIRSKGTGAIDLAAGSGGVNISNGGTVTAITRTAPGSAYTSVPSVTISAPTTAGGVQATATTSVSTLASGNTIASGGTGYTNGDVLTVVGGTGGPTQLTVTSVSGGVITGFSSTSNPAYTVTPANPVSVTGGTGNGATFNLVYGVGTSFTITNAGSGYIEQPTVSFSGGGGSGAAAYATVGGGTIVKALGQTGTSAISFYTAGGEVLRIRDSGSSGTYLMAQSSSTGVSVGTQTSGFLSLYSSSGAISFGTNGTSGQLQLNVAHTASAVNYVQVTGGVTTGQPTISAQGSDASIAMNYRTKGSWNHSFQNGSGQSAFIVEPIGSANYLQVTSANANSAPVLKAQGSDTNIDLALTPKGTGLVRFGTLTANADAPITGYITIKDSAGTTRKLAVIA